MWVKGSLRHGNISWKGVNSTFDVLHKATLRSYELSIKTDYLSGTKRIVWFFLISSKSLKFVADGNDSWQHEAGCGIGRP